MLLDIANDLGGWLSDGHNGVGATDVSTHLVRNNVLVNSLRTVALIPLWPLGLTVALLFVPAGMDNEKQTKRC